MGRHARLIIIFFLLAMIVAACARVPDSLHPSYEELLYKADLAFYRHEIHKAISYLENAIDIDPDASEAYARSALYQSYFQRSFSRGVRYGSQAVDLDPLDPENHLSLGRIYAHHNEHRLAIQCFQKALELKSAYGYKVAFLLATSQLALADTTSAIQTLKNVISIEPNFNPNNRLLHRLLVARKKYREALDIWRVDNYVISAEETPGQFWQWYLKLNNAIRTIEYQPTDPEAHLQLAIAYFEALLFEESNILLNRVVQLSPHQEAYKRRLEITTAYLQFMDEIRYVAQAQYLRTVNGRPNNQIFLQEIWDACRKMAFFFPELGPPPRYFHEVYFQLLREKLRTSFRAVLIMGETDGIFDCHYGHIIDEEDRLITVWDRQLKLRATYLDYMVDNGFNSWAWLYEYQDGGLSSFEDGYTVYSIRPPFVQSAVRDWWQTADIPIAGWQSQRPRKLHFELIKDPLDVYYSPQLQTRLRMNDLSATIQKFNKQLIDPQEKHTFFLKYLVDNKIEASVFNHEGQHAIDQTILNMSDPTMLEIRAKLTELYYAPFPFLTLAELMTPDIGARSYHGAANTYIFRQLAIYVHNHPHDFPGINTDKNIVAQLYKLERNQLHLIVAEVFMNTEQITGATRVVE